MVGCDSRTADDVIDGGTVTIDNDPVAMYLGYHGVWCLDTLGVYFVGLVVSPLL